MYNNLELSDSLIEQTAPAAPFLACAPELGSRAAGPRTEAPDCLPKLHLSVDDDFLPVGTDFDGRRAQKSDDDADELEAWELALRYLHVAGESDGHETTQAMAIDPTFAGKGHYALVGELSFALAISLVGAIRRRATEPGETEIPAPINIDSGRDPESGNSVALPLARLLTEPLSGAPAYATAFPSHQLDAGGTEYGAGFKWLRNLVPDLSETSRQQEIKPVEPEPKEALFPMPKKPRKISKSRTYMTIRSYHTLASIAEEYFGDADVCWLIAELNKGRVRESDVDGRRVIRLRDRQRITLPGLAEIESFYINRHPFQRAKNMVTVVEQSHVDLQRLNVELKPILNGADAI